MGLRRADVSDASSLAALSMEVWVGTYLREGVGTGFADFALETFTRERFEEVLTDPKEFFAVSQNVVGPDGFVRVSCDRPAPNGLTSDVEISTLYVQPRHHRRGIGLSLLNRGLEHARDLGAGSVWLTTNSQNAPAIGFYERHGFEKRGTTDFMIDGVGYQNDVFLRKLSG